MNSGTDIAYSHAKILSEKHLEITVPCYHPQRLLTTNY